MFNLLTRLTTTLGLPTLGMIRPMMRWAFPPAKPPGYGHGPGKQPVNTLLALALAVMTVLALYFWLQGRVQDDEIRDLVEAQVVWDLEHRARENALTAQVVARTAAQTRTVKDLETALGRVAALEATSQARATGSIDEHLEMVAIPDGVMDAAVPARLVELLAPRSTP